MAKGYWIVRVSARNAERYPEYVAATRPAYEKFGARFLVRGAGATQRKERLVSELLSSSSRTSRQPSHATKALVSGCQGIRNAIADFVIAEGVEA
jgi:uncharacterized protein (DUF1330 family)